MGYVTIKVHEGTRAHLRIIAAVTGEQMVQVLDRLCRAEADRVLSTLPNEKLIVVHVSKKEGNVYVDRLAKPNDLPNEEGSADDDTAGARPDGDA